MTELAVAFGRSDDSIRALVKTIMPSGKRGRANLYDYSEVGDVLKNTIKRTAKSSEAKSLEERKLELQCQKLEVEIDEKLGKLLPIDAVRSAYMTFVGHVRTHLIKQPGEIAPALEGLPVPRIQKELERHNAELMAKLSDLPV